MNGRAMVLTAAGLLVIGFFVPLAHLPIGGTMTYAANGRGDGTVILLLALVAGWLAVRGRMRPQLWIGLACAGVFAFTMLRFLGRAAETRARITHGLGGAFDGMAGKAAEPMVPQWGSAVVLLAIALILIAGWRARRS